MLKLLRLSETCTQNEMTRCLLLSESRDALVGIKLSIIACRTGSGLAAAACVVLVARVTCIFGLVVLLIEVHMHLWFADNGNAAGTGTGTGSLDFRQFTTTQLTTYGLQRAQAAPEAGSLPGL